MEGFLKLLAILLTFFFIFMFLLGINIKRRARKMQGKEFEAIKDGIVYFYSERCGACKMMKPEIEKLKEKVKVLEMDVAKPEGYKMAQELGILATPTTLVVRDGIIRKVFVGVVKSERILKEV
ncbi:MAG: thioredoxin family protein [Aquificota bacterium]|jgi:thioredoxin 1|nr:thioredoxin family protein [Aquificaceae bacterium]MDM7266999.1 thioredoxin family protein [Aquificaceae bacterium]HAV39494.1 thioredoxin [Aquificaceae bacterium]HCO39866.1 thioredoxin [Aquificaceae bacterium]